MELKDIITKFAEQNATKKKKEVSLKDKMKRSQNVRIACMCVIEWFDKHEELDTFGVHSIQNILKITYNGTKRILNSLVDFNVLSLRETECGKIYYAIRNNGHFVLIDYLETILIMNNVERKDMESTLEIYKKRDKEHERM